MKKVPLSRGEFALVDDGDFALVSRYCWQCHIDPHTGTKYAVAAIPNPFLGNRRSSVLMHRLILAHASENTDHKDGNGLNNQRNNIRPASRTENQRNRKLQRHSAPYKGVHLFKASGNWTASIRLNKRKIHLGYFKSPKAAAEAYDVAAEQHFGEFAKTNKQIGAL